MNGVQARPSPGELIYLTPECPLCGENVSYDSDSFWCEPCGATWSHRAGDQGAFDPNSEQCRKVLTNAAYPILSGRCILPDGHGSYHNNGKTDWLIGGYLTSSNLTETEVDA